MPAAILSSSGEDLRFKALPDAPFVFPPHPTENVKACPPRKSLSVNSVTSNYSRLSRTLSNGSSVYSSRLEPVKSSVVVTESMLDDIVLFTNVQAEQYSASVSPASTSDGHSFFPVPGQAYSAARPSSSSSPRRLSPQSSRLSGEDSRSPSPTRNSNLQVSPLRDCPTPAPEIPLPPIPRQTSRESTLEKLHLQTESAESHILNRRPVPPPKENTRSPISPLSASFPFGEVFSQQQKSLSPQPQRQQSIEEQLRQEQSSTFPVNPTNRKPLPISRDSNSLGDMGMVVSAMCPPSDEVLAAAREEIQKERFTPIEHPHELRNSENLQYPPSPRNLRFDASELSDNGIRRSDEVVSLAPTSHATNVEREGSMTKYLVKKTKKLLKSTDDENSTPDVPVAEKSDAAKPAKLSKASKVRKMFSSNKGGSAEEAQVEEVPAKIVVPYPGPQEAPSSPARFMSQGRSNDSMATIRPSTSTTRADTSPISRPTTANSVLTSPSDPSLVHPLLRTNHANNSTDTLQPARDISTRHAHQPQFGNNYISSPRSRNNSGAALTAGNRPQQPQFGDNSGNGPRSRTNSGARLLKNNGFSASQTDLSQQNNSGPRSGQQNRQQQFSGQNPDFPRSRANSGAGAQQPPPGSARSGPPRPAPTHQHSGNSIPNAPRSRANSVTGRGNQVGSEQDIMGSNQSTPRASRAQKNSAGGNSNAPRSRADSGATATQTGPGNANSGNMLPPPRPPQMPFLNPNDSRSRSSSINSRYGSANNSRANSLRSGAPPNSGHGHGHGHGHGNNPLPPQQQQQQQPRPAMPRTDYPMQRQGEPDPKLMAFLSGRGNPFARTPYALQQAQIAANPGAPLPELIQDMIHESRLPNLSMYRCDKNHGMSRPGKENSMRYSNNKVNSLTCAICRVKDKEDRFMCFGCALRCCIECKRRLESCDGNLKNVMQGLGKGSLFADLTKIQANLVQADEKMRDDDKAYWDEQERRDGLVGGDSTVEVENCDGKGNLSPGSNGSGRDVPGSFPRF